MLVFIIDWSSFIIAGSHTVFFPVSPGIRCERHIAFCFRPTVFIEKRPRRASVICLVHFVSLADHAVFTGMFFAKTLRFPKAFFSAVA